MKQFLKKIFAFIYKYGKSYERKNYIQKLKDRGLKVGKNLTLLQEVIIDETHCWHITIGDNVTIAPRVHILAHDASTKTHLGYTKIGKVSIGDRVFIGASSIIMPGVEIGDDAIIGAGSVVTKDVPKGSVAAGNPARVLMSTQVFLLKKEEEMKRYPLFDEAYTMRGNVTDEKKKQMNDLMEKRYGYIV